jgi:hypothetical protein
MGMGMGMGGIRDCGGPVEDAEEGHERSSIVSVESAAAGCDRHV